MAQKLKLFTSVAMQDALHAAHDATRKTSTTVKVDRNALIAILMDHGRLCDAVGLENLEVPT